MIEVRSYGTTGPYVVLSHGGPGAPGHMAPVARSLASRFRVLEPLQRGSGSVPLTVDLHVKDLHEVIQSIDNSEPLFLAGSSWGAMLALAYTAAHPARVDGLVLIGCGTFDIASRARFEANLQERTDDQLRARMQRLNVEIVDPDERLRLKADLLSPLYSHDLITTDSENGRVDAQAFKETWKDMLRLQHAGVYPAAFNSIKAPVLMIHGAYDPHPGRMIRDSLAPYLPQLEYIELEDCGHYPWLERKAREEFFACLVRWLSLQADSVRRTTNSK
ncbi:MAG: alpha/beta hydrolase [Bacteroidota bacterium]